MTVIDLGSGCTFTPTVNQAGERVGGIFKHPAKTGKGNLGDGQCGGSITFQGHAERGEAQWDVEQEDPLTLSPSLNCVACGRHGFIRNGQWEEC